MPAGKRIMLVPRRVDLKLYFLKHAVALCFLVVGYVVGPVEQRNMFHQNKTQKGGYCIMNPDQKATYILSSKVGVVDMEHTCLKWHPLSQPSSRNCLDPL